MSSDNRTENNGISELTETMVVEYLRHNPKFLRKHPELLTTLTPPERQTGDNVLDFQRFALGSLQQDMQLLKDEFDGVLTSARDNMSVQSQIHQAVMHMLKARDLEHLLEVLTMDFLRYFDVDAVRLIIESDVAELYDAYYGTENYSGISFVPVQTVDQVIGSGAFVALVTDTELDPPYAYEDIFVDCAALVQSCALLRIHLDTIDRDGIVGFGVREKGRFHAHQGVELLKFLADVMELRLDQCLNEHEIEKLL